MANGGDSRGNSKTVLSAHAVKVGCFKLNMGTDLGQKIYSAFMILLPMIPLVILIGRLSMNLSDLVKVGDDIKV